jgi:general stress protein 26
MPGYGIAPESKGGLLPWSFVEERMAKSRNYWIASTRSDGSPHVAPVWGLWHRDSFYFSTGEESRKGRNLAADPRAVAHLESGDEVVILEGVLETEEDDVTKQQLDKAYNAKYHVSLLAVGGLIYRLRVQRAFAWREQDFSTSATRWLFE